MDIAAFTTRNKTSALVLTLLLVMGGLAAYSRLGRLEDPEFTIKEAVVVTPYPGATAQEVEEEVTDLIEKAVQQLGQLDRVESRSERGQSTVTAIIKDKYDMRTLPQVWDELRRKVGDAQRQLPPGAGPSLVNDDFGDVFGVFFAITGEDYTHRELTEYAEFLQREILMVVDVAKVSLVGAIPEVVYVEMFSEKMAQFGVSKSEIYAALSQKNLVADAGRARVGEEYVSLRPTGEFHSVQEIGDLLIHGAGQDADSGLVFLRDIATIRRGYQDPPKAIMRVDGKSAVGVAISTVQGGNVVVMGEALTDRLRELLPATMPFGMELHRISIQSEAVTVAINGFVVSLLEAVAIVIVVLMLFMGLRSAALIGAILFITICGTIILMGQQGVMLERISLGALIIALGMLVDNAIVVTDGMLVRIQKGEDRLKAATAVVGQSMMPLLGATVVAVVAFAAIGTSKDSTGEYCRSLYQVILISLMLSWVTAVTLTPLFCIMFLKAKSTGSAGDDQDEYQGAFYVIYRKLLGFCMRWRGLTVGSMVVMLVLAMVGFGRIEQSFFPNSTRPQFMIDFWLPEGTHIRDTEPKIAQVESYLRRLEPVTSVASFVGQGAPRFLLTYAPEKPDSSYGYLLVSVDDYRAIDDLMKGIQSHLDETFPEASPIVYKFMLGPGDAQKIQVRLGGPDTRVLRELADQAVGVMVEDGGLMGVQTDWRDKVKVLRPLLAEAPARQMGIERADVARTLQEAFDGTPVGVYREGDDLLPILSRAPEDERGNVGVISDTRIWSPAAQAMIPLSQVLSGFRTVFDDSIIQRRNRVRTITVKCSQRTGNATVALARVKPKIDAIELPPGYTLEWGGEYENSRDAQAALAANLPLFVVIMVVIVIFLFNALRQPLIIWLCVPLAVIGVTAGLLATSQPFGFMALLGLLSLSGMLIKNAIVLIDQIDLEIREGKAPYDAILDSGVSRMRPVLMAAATTVLGMIPLLLDAFFVSMAVTIMAGLTFASVLTLVIVPVLYAIFFRVGTAESDANKA